MSTIAKNTDERGSSMSRGGFAEILEDLAEEEKLNIEEIREEALRIYFNLKPELRLEGAIISYLKGKCSLSRAAELAGVIVPEFKEILASKGVIRETEGKEVPEMDRKIKEILVESAFY
jgi:predicted HTH domain antitoxin